MKLLLYIACICLSAGAAAQSLRLQPAYDSLNTIRIKTNLTGMKILGGWSVANIATGAAGYFATDNKEWKAFHGMNAVWGAVNLGIAGMGWAGARKEMNAHYSCDEMLHRYESTKRLFLLNAGLDVLYISSGVYLQEHARTVSKDPDTWRGFGKSVTMQGIFLLVFDGVMFSMHQHQDRKWYRALTGICVTGNGIGFRYGL